MNSFLNCVLNVSKKVFTLLFFTPSILCSSVLCEAQSSSVIAATVSVKFKSDIMFCSLFEAFKTNFITKFYFLISECSVTQGSNVFLSFLLTLLIVFLAGCALENKKTEDFRKSIQEFCFRNQVKIFLFTIGLFFVLTLNTQSLCEAILGLMFFFYGLCISFLAHRAQLPVIQGFLVISAVTHVWLNGVPFHYVFGGLFFFYVYCVGVTIFKFWSLEDTFPKLTANEIFVNLQMRTELECFHVLEQLLYLNLGVRWMFPGVYNSLEQVHYLFNSYAYYGFLTCLVVRFVVFCLFNPFPDKKLMLFNFCTSCAAGYFTYELRELDIYIKATSESSLDPGCSESIREKQILHFKTWSSTTAVGLEVGKAWAEVYGTTPPLVKESTQINTEEALRIMEFEQDPQIIRLLEFFYPKIVNRFK
jgi:hypothetical protein